jgi:hypothetical protein
MGVDVAVALNLVVLARKRRERAKRQADPAAVRERDKVVLVAGLLGLTGKPAALVEREIGQSGGVALRQQRLLLCPQRGPFQRADRFGPTSAYSEQCEQPRGEAFQGHKPSFTARLKGR